MKNKVFMLVLASALIVPGTIKPIRQGEERTWGWGVGGVLGLFSGIFTAVALTPSRPMTPQDGVRVAAAATGVATTVGLLTKFLVQSILWEQTPEGRAESGKEAVRIIDRHGWAQFAPDGGPVNLVGAFGHARRTSYGDVLYPALVAYDSTGADINLGQNALEGIRAALHECEDSRVKAELTDIQLNLRRKVGGRDGKIVVLNNAIFNSTQYVQEQQALAQARLAARTARAAEQAARAAARTAAATEEMARNTRNRDRQQ